MKNLLFTFSFTILSSFLISQETLQHFDPEITPPIAETFANGDGFMTGHNEYGDEEFAEKYEIEGNGTVHGLLAIHDGIEGTSTFNAFYRVYNVGTNGLPNTPIANKSVPYNDIEINESIFPVEFTTPVNVSGEFFVSFGLGDYAHGGAGTKKLAITHAPDGTRPASDFEVFGRNAIRWHSHGAVVWKDYRTENFSDYQPAVYFSIFPIVELESMSAIDFDKSGSIGAVYPNPSSSGLFYIPVKSNIDGESTFQLYDLTGKLISQETMELSLGKKDYPFSTKGINTGVYLLLIKTPLGKVAQRVIIQ